MARPDELTFAPLGGVGEIGMNLSIYGLGNRHQRSWLAVDLGVSFGDEEHLPGIALATATSAPGSRSISACPLATRSICRASI